MMIVMILVVVHPSGWLEGGANGSDHHDPTELGTCYI
jgi:hypothetical protein